MKLSRITLAIIVTAFAACGSAGTQVTRAKAATIVKGKTTRDEVVATLGEPNSLTRDSNGRETLHYAYARSTVKPATFIPIVGAFAGGVNTQTSAFDVKLNPSGVVEEYLETQGTMGTNAFGR
jgi:outer membrane protein assembly factor BamE (lipoprotein component of BamABCDE complex)